MALNPSTLRRGDWTLPKMQDLSRHKRIIIDTETTGVNVWAGDRTIGVVVGTFQENGKIDSRYYPYGHPDGPQYTRREVIDWLNLELRGKELIFHHYNFDALMLHADGLDVRQYENQMFDTQFAGALINPKAPSNLDFMVKEYVPEFVYRQRTRKIKDLPFEPEDYCKVPSWALGEYAEQDGIATGHLFNAIWKKIIQRLPTRVKGVLETSLEQVYRLECETAPAVLEMELNGLRIDEEKLRRWIPQAEKQYQEAMHALSGVNPNSARHLVPAFEKRGIAYQFNYVCTGCDDEWKGYAPQECPRCGEPKAPKSPQHKQQWRISTG